MLKHFSLSISLALLVVTGCAKGDGDMTGTAGTGGGEPPPAGLGSGGPFNFPQSKTSGACSITSNSNATAAMQNVYNSWKSTFVTSNGAPGGLRVQSPQHSGGTVSEGMGYGMI